MHAGAAGGREWRALESRAVDLVGPNAFCACGRQASWPMHVVRLPGAEMLQQPVVEPADLDDGEPARRRRGPGVEIVQEGPDFVPLGADLPAEDDLSPVVPHRHGQLLAMLVNAHGLYEEVLLDEFWGSLEETELGDPQWIRRALTVSRGAPLFHGISAFPCFHTRRDSPGIVNRLSRTGRTATRAIPCYATNAIPC